MAPGFIVRLRPSGPWRIGPESGARDRVDRVYHSDSLYSAVCGAMLRLGSLEEWLDATARNPAGSAVRFSSCFPFQGDTLLAPPPSSHWPPQSAPQQSAKVRWKGARFVPLPLIASLVRGEPFSEDAWAADGPSECVLPADRNAAARSPFRVTVRSSAAVDRVVPGLAEPHSTACLEFSEGSGLWAATAFADPAARRKWREPVKAAFRLLADSGFGGERSRGWGRAETPEFSDGFPGILGSAPNGDPEGGQAWWLLSLFTPAESDIIDWHRGNYSLVTRSGRVESPVRSGDEKKQVRMVAEGAVLVAGGALNGAARDVAPDGFPHPVYRAGFALAIPISWRVPA